MSYEETLRTSDDGQWRVRLIADESPPEPYDDGQSPLLRIEYTSRGWIPEHVMATGRPADDDARIESAASQWGYGWNRGLFEKYLRAYYGTREIVAWHSGDCWYITYDTARWRSYIGFEPGAETPHPLVNMDEWRAYCEGDCWGYIVERRVTWYRDGDPATTRTTWEEVEDGSCWGFYGDYGREAALEAYEAEVQPYEHLAGAHEIRPDLLAHWDLKTATSRHGKYHRMARDGQIPVSHNHDDPSAPFTITAELARPHCGTPMTHPDKSVSHCVLEKDHFIAVEDSDHQDEHGHTGPVLVSQATIREVASVSREWPDGVHTCTELQQLEPGRRTCTCGKCPIADRSE
jgi:hypothetical protein